MLLLLLHLLILKSEYPTMPPKRPLLASDVIFPSDVQFIIDPDPMYPAIPPTKCETVSVVDITLVVSVPVNEQPSRDTLLP